MTPAKPRKRLRTALRASPGHPEPDGSLPQALNALADAVHALTQQRAHHIEGRGTTWIPDRYSTLRQALYGSRGAGGHHRMPGSMIPAWVDAMKLLIHIDTRTHGITPRLRDTDTADGSTPSRLRWFAERKFRPQDSQQLETVATEIASWSIAIDDIFAPKPKFLPDRCPRCGNDHTYRKTDDGQKVRSPALELTVERGCRCLSCHDVWPPSELQFLGRLLGYKPPSGVVE